MKSLAAPLLALAALVPASALAAPPPLTAQAPDPAKLAEARAIIDVMFPPAERERMMTKMMADIADPCGRACRAPPSQIPD